MKTVLMATGYREEAQPLIRCRPTPLLAVADKPIIVRILERLIGEGCKEFHLILSYLPEMIEEELEEGKRWGVELTFHLAKDEEHSLSVLKTIARNWKEEKVLIGLGDAIPQFNLQSLHPPCLLQFPDGRWSGWGLVPPAMLGKGEEEMLDLCSRHPVEPLISCESVDAFASSNQRFLQGEPKLSPPDWGVEVEPGIWISRGVSLHPTAKVRPPVLIGSNSQIHEKAVIGPHAIVENHSIVDARSHVENSIVCHRSYVGELLDVKNSIIDRNMLISLNQKAHMEVREDFIISEIESPRFTEPLAGFLEQMIALPIFLLSLPMLLIMILIYPLKKSQALRLPSSEKDWRTFTLRTLEGPRHFRKLPWLINVVSGNLHFTGVAPRTAEDAERLPDDWRKLYLKSKAGIISLSELDHEETEDDRYAAEAYYAAHMGPLLDLKLIIKWLLQKLRIR